MAVNPEVETPSTLAGLRLWLQMVAAVHYESHRLIYVHQPDDEPLFGCKCGEGFSERRNFNLHIRDSFVESLM